LALVLKIHVFFALLAKTDWQLAVRVRRVRLAGWVDRLFLKGSLQKNKEPLQFLSFNSFPALRNFGPIISGKNGRK
jgi:hypothetical protein